MECQECGMEVEKPTHFEETLDVCFTCLRASIPKIESSVTITRPLGRLRCIFCLGKIIMFKPPKKIDTFTDGATKGIISAFHPVCKLRFLNELDRRGYTPLMIGKKPRKRYPKKKKKRTLPVIRNLEDMKKWITKQGQ